MYQLGQTVSKHSCIWYLPSLASNYNWKIHKLQNGSQWNKIKANDSLICQLTNYILLLCQWVSQVSCYYKNWAIVSFMPGLDIFFGTTNYVLYAKTCIKAFKKLRHQNRNINPNLRFLKPKNASLVSYQIFHRHNNKSPIRKITTGNQSQLKLFYL